MEPASTALEKLLSKMNNPDFATVFNDALRRFEIVYTDDRGNSRAFVLPIEPDVLWQQIRVTESDRDALWPDVSVEEASLRLFTVHLLEAVMMAEEGQDTLVKTPSGMLAV